MGKIVNSENIEQIRLSNQGLTIGICTGCFDILQSGHAYFFKQCKELCDVLLVVVGRASVISRIKPGRPINPDNNRLYLIAALEDVDFATLGDAEPLPGKIDCYTVCKILQPDVYILNDDDSGLAEKILFCNENGIELRFVPRSVPDFLTATSTSELIRKSGISET